MSVCEWCGDEFTAPNRKGPKPRFCRRSHRQRAYEHRKAQKEIQMVMIVSVIVPGHTQEGSLNMQWLVRNVGHPDTGKHPEDDDFRRYEVAGPEGIDFDLCHYRSHGAAVLAKAVMETWHNLKHAGG